MLRFLMTVTLVAMAIGEGVQQTGEQDPCKNYVSITEEKRSVKYKATVEDLNLSDKDIAESVWYRFQGLPPQRLHDSCLLGLGCGTDQPVWMNGTHPTAADPGPKDVDVCSQVGRDCCGWKNRIQVMFCRAAAADDDDFYVYLLKRTLPDMAYCSGDIDVCPNGTAWNPNSKTCTQPFPTVSLPVFDGPVRATNTLKGTETCEDFYFTCNIQWSNPDALKKGEQFEVVFTFDGQPDETGVPPKRTNGSDLSVKLWSQELKGHAGKTVGCKVRSHWKLVRKMSRYQVAEKTYFVGINYSTPDTCLIDGRCFRSGEASRLSRCQKCVPSKSRDSWTHDKTERECSDSATSLSFSKAIFAAIILMFFIRI